MDFNLPLTEEPPMVSVIIVSWNARSFLEQCLASLTSHSCRYPMEIIVVDNASTDDSVACVQERFPHVGLIRNPSNLGFAKANNIGIAASRGRFLCLINSDVKVLKDCITRLVDYCLQHPEAGMVGPHVTGGDGRLQRSCRGFPNLWNMFCRAMALDTFFPRAKPFCGYALSYWAHDAERQVDILSGCFWLVRREALNQAGLLDESFFFYGEDMDWCRRFKAAGWKRVFVPSAEAIHYGGASSANAPTRFYIEMQKADLHYWAKHHGGVALGGYFLIACSSHFARVVSFSLLACFGGKRRSTYLHKASMGVRCLGWMLFGILPSRVDPPRINQSAERDMVATAK